MSRSVRKIVVIIAIAVAGIAALTGVWFLLLDPYRGTTSRNDLKETLPVQQALTKDQAGDDLRYLAARIGERHVAAIKGLPDAVQQQLGNEIARLPETPTVLDVWQASSRIVKLLGDAHTSVSFYATEKSSKLLEQQFVVTSAGKLFCTAGPYPGRKPVTFGGVAADDLYARFLAMYSYENIHWANRNFPNYLRSAEQLNWLGVPAEGSVQVLLEGDPQAVELPFADPLPADSTEPDFVRNKIDRDRELGILTLDKCTVNQHYKDVLKQFFTDVKSAGIGTIAVDLRNNGGGNSGVVNEFLRYLPVDSYLDYGARMRLGPILTDSKPERAVNKRVGQLEFNGDVYVLTGRGTFSSAMWFAVILSDNDLCRVIGQPPGNRPSAYGDVLLFQMPHSRLAFSLTYKQFTRPNRAKDSEDALMPDYPTDLTEVGDGVMDKLYELVKIK